MDVLLNIVACLVVVGVLALITIFLIILNINKDEVWEEIYERFDEQTKVPSEQKEGL